MSRLVLFQFRFFSSKPAKSVVKTGEHIKTYNFENKALFGASKKSKKSEKVSQIDNNKHEENEKSSEMYWLLHHKPEDPTKEENYAKRKKKEMRSSSRRDSASHNEDFSNTANNCLPVVEIPFSNQGLNSILKFPLAINQVQNYPETVENCEVPYPSVGKVLQATMTENSRKSLMAWKLQKITELGEEGFKRMQEAQLLEGKIFHKTLEDYLCSGIVPQWDSDVNKLWRSVSPVLTRLQPKIELAEKMIEHPHLKYRGIVDCVCSIGSETTVIEWKKSEKVKPTLASTFDAPLQLCAYLGALSVDPKFKLQASKGYVIVANTDGKEAQVHQLDYDLLQRYWYLWLRRLQEYWVRTRDGTLPEPI